MYQVVAKKVDKDAPILLPAFYDSKAFVIGREQVTFQTGARGIGRRQACFSFDTSTGDLELESGSSNPNVVKTNRTGKETIKILRSKEKMSIFTGDQVSILGTAMWIEFTIVSTFDSQNIDPVGMTLKKRKRSDDDEEEEDLDLQAPNKKRKLTHYPAYVHPGVRFGVSKGNWKTAFIDFLKNENSDINKRRIYHRDSSCVTLYDAFPKAKRHLVMIARQNIESVLDLRRRDLPLLKHLKVLSSNIADHLVDKTSSKKFIIGFHSEPSLSRLHLHIISNDLTSECLKNKKHFNSFTTPFLLTMDEVIHLVETKGSVKIDLKAKKAHLKANLKCHICGQRYRFLPKLKQHLDHCWISQ